MVDARAMNAVGSTTGKVMHDAPDTSVGAAKRVKKEAAEQRVWMVLDDRPQTSKEISPQVGINSNIVCARLIGLWERQLAYVMRERGRCYFGVCHPHPVHSPHAKCEQHGKPLVRDGAGIWKTEDE